MINGDGTLLQRERRTYLPSGGDSDANGRAGPLSRPSHPPRDGLHPQYRTLSDMDPISLEGDPVRQSSNMNHPIGITIPYRDILATTVLQLVEFEEILQSTLTQST